MLWSYELQTGDRSRNILCRMDKGESLVLVDGHQINLKEGMGNFRSNPYMSQSQAPTLLEDFNSPVFYL